MPRFAYEADAPRAGETAPPARERSAWHVKVGLPTGRLQEGGLPDERGQSVGRGFRNPDAKRVGESSCSTRICGDAPRESGTAGIGHMRLEA
eukprot:724736-Alexandrium_andersonii.AAC.1